MAKQPAVFKVENIGTTTLCIPADQVKVKNSEDNNTLTIEISNDLLIRVAEEIKHHVHQYDTKISG